MYENLKLHFQIKTEVHNFDLYSQNKLGQNFSALSISVIKQFRCLINKKRLELSSTHRKDRTSTSTLQTSRTYTPKQHHYDTLRRRERSQHLFIQRRSRHLEATGNNKRTDGMVHPIKHRYQRGKTKYTWWKEEARRGAKRTWWYSTKFYNERGQGSISYEEYTCKLNRTHLQEPEEAVPKVPDGRSMVRQKQDDHSGLPAPSNNNEMKDRDHQTMTHDLLIYTRSSRTISS